MRIKGHENLKDHIETQLALMLQGVAAEPEFRTSSHCCRTLKFKMFVYSNAKRHFQRFFAFMYTNILNFDEEKQFIQRLRFQLDTGVSQYR
jgi:hypothetical protein